MPVVELDDLVAASDGQVPGQYPVDFRIEGGVAASRRQLGKFRRRAGASEIAPGIENNDFIAAAFTDADRAGEGPRFHAQPSERHSEPQPVALGRFQPYARAAAAAGLPGFAGAGALESQENGA